MKVLLFSLLGLFAASCGSLVPKANVEKDRLSGREAVALLVLPNVLPTRQSDLNIIYLASEAIDTRNVAQLLNLQSRGDYVLLVGNESEVVGSRRLDKKTGKPCAVINLIFEQSDDSTIDLKILYEGHRLEWSIETFTLTLEAGIWRIKGHKVNAMT